MITVTTKRLQTRLVTLADLKVAIVPGDSDDVYLASLIDRVTSHIESRTGMKFGREVLTETFNGNGRTTQMLRRFPIVNLGALTLDAATIATTEYEIFEEGESGQIFMETGWQKNIPIASEIEVHHLPQAGDDDYSLIYTYGYLLPSDNIIAADAFIDCAADATAKTFTRTSGKWPLLVDGDKITFGGFADTTLNIEYTVASRTALVITVDETPTGTEAAGATVTLDCQTLPEEIEQAAIELVNSWFKGRKRDSALKSERIGDWAGVFGGAETPYVKEILNHYKVIF
jgi:hypothetical protein